MRHSNITAWKMALNRSKDAGLNHADDTTHTFRIYLFIFLNNSYHPALSQLKLLKFLDVHVLNSIVQKLYYFFYRFQEVSMYGK